MTQIILGLGSNLDDRLHYLRQALNAIKNISGITVQQVSPVYVSDALTPANAPDDWRLPFLNAALRCETILSPSEVFATVKNIEQRIGRLQNQARWAPRIIDIDLLAWEGITLNTPELHLPHPELLKRPFALWPLADVAPFFVLETKTAAEQVEAWGSRFTGEAPFHTRQINQRIDTPECVGIINLTPDSFSDGGQALEIDRALQQALQLVSAGATVLDLGAEATSPHAKAIDPTTEWARLEPILDALTEFKRTLFITPKISIDTRHVTVAEKALPYGVDWINDVSGLDDPAMRSLIAGTNVDCVIMHHLYLPERRDQVLPRHQNPVQAVLEWGTKRLDELEKSGIQRQQLIFDPGIGFGKMAEQSLYLLQHVAQFSQLGMRVMVGHSRKTFLSLFTDLPFPKRDVETTAISLYLAKQPVHYLRLHDVEMCTRAFKVMAAL